MNEQLFACLLVMAGGGLGSLARYGVTLLSARYWGEIFPWGTLGINVTGSFAIGLFFTLTLAEGAMPASANTRLFVMTGLCGGFTTFSAFSLQTLQLINEREYGPALFYIVSSVVLCIAAAAVGYWIGAGARLPVRLAQPSPKPQELLVFAPNLETLDASLNAAREVAPAFGNARLAALHTRIHPSQQVALSEEVMDEHSAAVFRESEKSRAEAIRARIAEWSGREGQYIDFIDSSIGVADALYAHGWAADLIIVGKTPLHSRVEERETLTIALFELRRPVLLVPFDWRSSVGRKISIGWKAAPQTVRAIEAAAPLLKQANDVHILAGSRESAPATIEVEKIMKGLKVTAQIESFAIGEEAVGKTLLDMARERASDLLVIGAYSHSRIAEYLLGGVTRYILSHANMPVLLMH